jgi:hypothetical protein
MLTAIPLIGCDPQTGSTATSVESICAGWRAIRYSGRGDTAMTIKQVRTHNRVGQSRGCW